LHLSLVIVAILGRGAWRVLKESAHILLEGVPDGINLREIADTLTARVPGVLEVHHVHAWALTAEKPMVTLHANVDEQTERILAFQRAYVEAGRKRFSGVPLIDLSRLPKDSEPTTDLQPGDRVLFFTRPDYAFCDLVLKRLLEILSL